MNLWPKKPEEVAKKLDQDTAKADAKIEEIKRRNRIRRARFEAHVQELGSQVVGFIRGTTPQEGVDIKGFERWMESGEAPIELTGPVPPSTESPPESPDPDESPNPDVAEDDTKRHKVPSNGSLPL